MVNLFIFSKNPKESQAVCLVPTCHMTNVDSDPQVLQHADSLLLEVYRLNYLSVLKGIYYIL